MKSVSICSKISFILLLIFLVNINWSFDTFLNSCQCNIFLSLYHSEQLNLLSWSNRHFSQLTSAYRWCKIFLFSRTPFCSVILSIIHKCRHDEKRGRERGFANLSPFQTSNDHIIWNKFNWLEILMMFYEHQQSTELCFLLRMMSDWKLIRIKYYSTFVCTTRHGRRGT